MKACMMSKKKTYGTRDNQTSDFLRASDVSLSYCDMIETLPRSSAERGAHSAIPY